MEHYQCSLCQLDKPEDDFSFRLDGRARAVRAQCKECRRKRAGAKRYPTPCSRCGYHRRLDSNGYCSKCNAAAGLRECRRCTQLLVAFLHFYRKQRVCKDCQKLKAPPIEG
jgi:hypothetical protein